MDSGSQFTAFLIALLVSAVPSAVYGAVLARRLHRPTWHGVLPGFFLPWFGLLFLGAGQPSGTRRVTGAARYSMVMLFIAAAMVMISTFLPWLQGDGSAFGRDVDFSYTPNGVTSVAILVWGLALVLLLGGLSVAFHWPLASSITITVLIAIIGGAMASQAYLYGPPGVLMTQLRGSEGEALAGSVQVASGGWLAFVALVTSYWALMVMPFGLKLAPPAPTPAPAAEPPPVAPTYEFPVPEQGGAARW